MSDEPVKKERELEPIDKVELMLKKTGCIELHYAVQECFFETHDWRQCQDQIKKFKDCMNVYRESQEKKYS